MQAFCMRRITIKKMITFYEYEVSLELDNNVILDLDNNGYSRINDYSIRMVLCNSEVIFVKKS